MFLKEKKGKNSDKSSILKDFTISISPNLIMNELIKSFLQGLSSIRVIYENRTYHLLDTVTSVLF